MLSSSIPVKFPIPFAKNAGGGFIRSIPQASQVGILAGAASLNDGLPPACFTPTGSGGTPPWGQDFNGLFNQITSWNQWQQAGGTVLFDQTFSTAIGGYPQGAVLASTSSGIFWYNTVDNNTTNPDGGSPSGWLSFGPNATSTNQASLIHSGADAGTANAISVASVTPTVTSVTAGMVFEITKINSPNTGAMTATIAGQAGSLVWADGVSALVSGDWPAGAVALVMWDGSKYRMISNPGPAVFVRAGSPASIGTVTLATTQTLSNATITQINMTGTVPFGSVSAGTVTLTQGGIYAITLNGTSLITPSGTTTMATDLIINVNGSPVSSSSNLNFASTAQSISTFVAMTLYIAPSGTLSFSAYLGNVSGGIISTLLTAATATITKVG